MRRKLFCVLLSLVMVISMMPAMTVTACAGVIEIFEALKTTGEVVDAVMDTAKKMDAATKLVDNSTSVITVKAGDNGKVNFYLPLIVPVNTAVSVDGDKLKIGLLTTVTATPSENYDFYTWTGVPVNGKAASDLTITAMFKKKTYTVGFDMANIGIAPSKQTVAHGDKVRRPANPVAQGYIFEGWYKDAEYSTAWNFDTDVISGAATLYAKWTEIPPEPVVEEPVIDIEAIADALRIRCSTAKEDKGIRVTANVIEGDIVTALSSGYTISYDFYRSLKPKEEYEYMFSSKTGAYKNTSVKKGNKYYYKATVVILDADGNEVAATTIENCKYGSRKF